MATAKPFPDYTKECHNTIRQYICTHRRLVATPTHIFPCIFYNSKNSFIAIHCTRIREPPKIVQIKGLCDRCAPPQTIHENSCTQETRQANPAQPKKSRDICEKEPDKANAGILTGINIVRKQENEEGITLKVHEAFQANRGRKNIGKLTNKQHDASIVDLTNLLTESHISAAAAERDVATTRRNIHKEQKTQLQVPQNDSNASTSKPLIETETKDLKGKTRGWVSVNPSFTLKFPSVSNGEPFEKLTLMEKWFGKRAITDEEALDKTFADGLEGSTWKHGDEEWEDVKRECAESRVNSGIGEEKKRK